jgi:hypothetical protein
MLDPENTWRDRFAELKIVNDISWASNIASLTDELTTGKLQITEITPPSSFTFNKAIFQAQLLPIVFAPTPIPQLAIAAAWGAAMTASTMVVSSGASVGAPSPATTFSAPPVTLLLPPTIAAAQAALAATLIAAVPVPDAKQGILGPALRTAFITVKASVTGINSITPTPTPLVLPTGSLG